MRAERRWVSTLMALMVALSTWSYVNELQAASTRATQPSAGTAVERPPGYDATTGQRSYSQHAFTKIRPGSYLKNEQPMPEIPDLRGELEHRRDAELVRHFARMAELDVIAEVADKVHNSSLQERVEEVRRKETERFHDAMQDLRQVVLRKVVALSP